MTSYDKNWRYPGGGRGQLIDCVLTGNDVDVKLDEASRLRIEKSEWGGVTSIAGPDAEARLEVVDCRLGGAGS